jgi:hypothetical protein
MNKENMIEYKQLYKREIKNKKIKKNRNKGVIILLL